MESKLLSLMADADWLGEGAGCKPLSVHHMAGRIQLSVRPAPRRRASSGLFGLAPVGVLVPSVHGRSPPFGFIAHTRCGSFLLQSRPSRAPGMNRATCVVERGLSSVSYTVSDPPAPSYSERQPYGMNRTVCFIGYFETTSRQFVHGCIPVGTSGHRSGDPFP